MKFKTNCTHCNNEITRKTKTKTGRYYCDLNCKAEWQREQKPATKEWLHQKYIVEGLSANDIAKIVKRNPKRVWEWLRDYDIETRPRGSDWKNKNGFAFWLEGKPSPFKGQRHTDENRKKFREMRLKDGHVPYLTKDGKHYMKGRTGKRHHGYIGGSTPERQSFYSSEKWKEVVKEVWRRDNAICQKCGIDHRDINRNEMKFHIHHIFSFTKYKETRDDIGNLILLCEHCHRWVHSKNNVKKEFLPNQKVVLPKWIKK